MAERELRRFEIIKAGDRIEWTEGAWTKIDPDSEFVGRFVDEVWEREQRIMRFKRDCPLVYCFTIFTTLHLMRGWCCDRQYKYIDDVSWRNVKIGDIIETGREVYFSPPLWAEALIGRGEKYLTYWTNYYNWKRR